jgi:hypothetical protein
MFALTRVRRGLYQKNALMGHSFELLSVEERVGQYREMADATFLKAKKAEDPVVRAQFLDLATRWHALAQELEAGNPDPEMFPDAAIMEVHGTNSNTHKGR